jgi:hypothetical protein
MKERLSRICPAGLVVHGRQVQGNMEGVIELMFAALLGCIGGFIVGMLLGVTSRIATVNRVKGVVGGPHWAAYGAALGAVGLACIRWFA